MSLLEATGPRASFGTPDGVVRELPEAGL